MILREDLSLVGKINKTHGIKGELSISFFDEAVADSIEPGTCLIMDMDGIFTPFFATSVRPRSHEALLVIFDDFTDQQLLSQCVGKDVYLRKVDLPKIEEEEEDGLYAGQLIGYTAQDVDGNVIGEITDIDDATDNVLFVISRDGQSECYIPVVDDFIVEIDESSCTIKFDLPEGMLQL